MGAYHQLGHHSANLVLELPQFHGAILSPVNYSPTDTSQSCVEFRQKRQDLDIIFDPQLYVPRQYREKLAEWPYMPNSFETTDIASASAWLPIIDAMIAAVTPFEPNGICSPAPYPRSFNDDYYGLLADLANSLTQKLHGSNSRPFLTALVSLGDLSLPDRYLHVASILSKYKASDIYLVLCDDTVPRQERAASGELEAAARLIRLLVDAGYQILVGSTSSEMLLWKAAGAQHAASGKFFNLRRFTRGRFDAEEESGGRNIWYWFEPSLLAFIRQADLIRYMKQFEISALHKSNPYSQEMLRKLNDPEKPPLLADSWRQFLFWFAYAEGSFGNDGSSIGHALDVAEARWKQVIENKLRFEEPHNNGEWVRAWNIALNELLQRPD